MSRGLSKTVDLGHLVRGKFGDDPRRCKPRVPPGLPKSRSARRFTAAKDSDLAPLRVNHVIEILQESIDDEDNTKTVGIAQSLFDTLAEIHEQHPQYFRSSNCDREICQDEIDAWLAALSGCANGSANGMGLVITCIRDRLAELFRMILAPDSAKESPVLSLEQFNGKSLPGRSLNCDLDKLQFILDNSSVRQEDKANLTDSITLIRKELEKKLDQQDEVGRLNREVDRLNQRNKELAIENFDVKNERITYDYKIEKLVAINDGLRKTILDQEHTIHALIHSKSPCVMKGIGTVPTEVLQIWDQMSHFCKNILDGDLFRTELDSYFPKDVSSSFARPYFVMNRLHCEERAIHFSAFFDEIKKAYQPEGLFENLESQIRTFILKASELYEKNVLELQKDWQDVLLRATKKLDDTLHNTTDQSQILKTFVLQKQFFRIPPKIACPDVRDTITGFYKYVTTHDPPKSVTHVLVDYFGGIENPDLVCFIAQLAKLSKKDKEVELCQKFVVDALPLHQFLFYAEVFTKCTTDGLERPNVLNLYFGTFGWKTLPREKRRLFETNYVRNPLMFVPFCLAMYSFCIDKIEETLSVVAPSDVESAAQTMLNLSESELFAVSEFLKAMGDDGKPTPKALAILLFKRRAEFRHILFTFDPDESEVLASLMTQPGKRKRCRSGKKSRNELSNTLPAVGRSVHVSRVANSLHSTTMY